MLLKLNWNNFRSIHGEEDSRNRFENLMYDLLCEEYSSKIVHKTDSSRGGDGGIDIFVERDDGIDIYQCKFFIDKIEKAQWEQITSSFEKSISTAKKDGMKVCKWYLCTPFIANRDPIGPWKRWNVFVNDNIGKTVDSLEWFDGARIIQKLEQQKSGVLRVKYFTFNETVPDNKDKPTKEPYYRYYNDKSSVIQNMGSVHPKVFISYSWTTEEYKKRVLNLAIRLRNNGVNVILDQWDLKPGHDMFAFMEQSIRDAEKVLILCEAGYVSKANDRIGGVGAETQIITSDVYGKHKQEKFIPVIMEHPITLPSYLRSRYAVNFTNDEEKEYKNLWLSIFGLAEEDKPPVGDPPLEWLNDRIPLDNNLKISEKNESVTNPKSEKLSEHVLHKDTNLNSKTSFSRIELDNKRIAIISLKHPNLHNSDRYYELGHYPQGNNFEESPLLWRVLDIDSKNHRALLITEYLIDSCKYHGIYKDTTWENSTLRKWLNNDFYNNAFSKEEHNRIIEVYNQNLNNAEYGTKGGNPTKDKVFSLSLNEAEQYFKDCETRRTAVTPYAKKQGCFCSDTYTTSDGQQTGWWWLRSPGGLGILASVVNGNGSINAIGNYVFYEDVAVRPALWLKL